MRLHSFELSNLNHIKKIQVPLNDCTSRRCLAQRFINLVAWSTAPNVFSLNFIHLSLNKFVHHFTYSRQKAPDMFHRPLQSGGSEYRKYSMLRFWRLEFRDETQISSKFLENCGSIYCNQWRTEGGSTPPPPHLKFRWPSKIVPNSTRL